MGQTGVWMKKLWYVALFTLLGFLFQLGLHAVLETAYIALLTSNYGVFGLGLSWDVWFTIHTWFTGIMAVIGLAAGVWLGLYCWPMLYDEHGKIRDLSWRHRRKATPE